MRKSTTLLATGAVAALAATMAGTTGATAAAGDGARAIPVQLLSFNDYHGHLEATDGPLASDPAETPAGGGVEYLSAKLDQLRAKVGDANSLTVAAGDTIGGSTFLSGMFHDEPSVESLNTLGLDVTSVGNHEFDEGTAELLRMQRGGCHPVDGCYFDDQPFEGADYPYLAANVVKKATNKLLLPGTTIRRIGGVPIGFIGLTLKETPTLVDPAGVASVRFKDEVSSVNQQAGYLNRQGVKAIVVLIHQGGTQEPPTSDYDGCTGFNGPIAEMAPRFSSLVDVVVSGHTHQPYVCTQRDPQGRPRLVTSAASYGQMVTETNFTIDSRSRDINRNSFVSHNVLVDRATTPDPAETAVIDKWKTLAGPIAATVVGTVAQDVTGDASGNRGIETPMADLIADSILWGTQSGNSQIALMNVGGVRASFLVNQISNGEDPGKITYTEAYNVAPFGNLLVTMDMTGQQIKDTLEQQYDPTRGRQYLALGVSEGFSYTWDDSRPQGSKVVAGSMTLNGAPMSMTATYRVGTLNFLANGGDNFTGFMSGTNLLGGKEDLQNLVDYLGTHPGITPPPDRVSGL
ncbi:5'-Nucleotidase domain-containing protein [Nostocoides australiense Ben110]|uniref:5'-Nucleotidase domain-containing protein n=1 Tax=Nostocoides australiense Ben110 TaxID=1193182 RepID=W6K307_9MICO|nr:bifunctional metallophosphatase/5'-nucleotidase [Tetrasphaera australiensis]CCH75560.1 5'-Nucleotidase domain-containing protein [Tetrasphaera australiensis Ben110]